MNEKPLKIVKLPLWWTEGKLVYGTTDAITTYCCSSEPSYYVSVPEYEYEGYFKISDLEVMSIKR